MASAGDVNVESKSGYAGAAVAPVSTVVITRLGGPLDGWITGSVPQFSHTAHYMRGCDVTSVPSQAAVLSLVVYIALARVRDQGIMTKIGSYDTLEPSDTLICWSRMSGLGKDLIQNMLTLRFHVGAS